ncbi:MAG: DegT/DnrJ/EryC1/StrS family aminotransferase [Armatimonadetes bacterium]|nr:DegT/DnrJ/EryC1/StrS family aminotransferase [Armatimonadota bacterium]
MVYDVYRWKVPYRIPIIDEPIVEAVLRVMRSGALFRGEDTRAFEQEMADYVGVKYGASTNSGTSALALMWEGLAYPAGSEVIMQANGYIAGASTAMQAGLRPVFVEPDEETHTLDVERVREAITPRTRAIYAIHMYGHPTDMDPLVALCERHGIDLIEVLAHATGARYRGRKVGSFGRAAMTTFGSKMVTVNGLGGMLLTNEEALAAGAISLRKNVPDQGVDYYHMERLPHNYQLSEPLAAMGRINLRRLDEHIARRRQHAARLTAMLRAADLPIHLPVEREWATHAYLHYVIRAPHRDELRAFLADRRVEARLHYECPVYLIGPIRRALGHDRGDFPISDRICSEVISLPVGPWLSDDQVDYLGEQVVDFFKTRVRPAAKPEAARR